MASQADLDYASLFGQLRSILSELYEEVTQQIEILPRSNQPLQSFSNPDGNVTGSLLTFGKGARLAGLFMV